MYYISFPLSRKAKVHSDNLCGIKQITLRKRKGFIPNS